MSKRRSRISAIVGRHQRGPGRPMEPTASVTKDALWKRAQRADDRPPNRDMVRDHLDGEYGRRSPKTQYISRAQHNRIHAERRVRRRKGA
jgi:hypothetical protein